MICAFSTINTHDMYVIFTTTKRIEKHKSLRFLSSKLSPLKLFFLLKLFVSTYSNRGLFPTFGIRAPRMLKQMSSPCKGTGGEVTTIKSGKEGSATLQYPLLTKSNYAARSIKIRVDLYAQGVWDVVEHYDIEERKDRMTLDAIYQAKRTFFSCL